MTPLSVDSKTDRALVLAVDVIAFYIRTTAWMLLTWAPLAGVCMLVARWHDDEIRSMAIALLCLPLLGLLLKWMSSGIFDLKLGRMIAVMLLNIGYALLMLTAVVWNHDSSPSLGPMLMVLALSCLVAAILGYGLVRRNSLLRRTNHGS
jgi:hypothetical protein